jgi:hypothetical protein
MRGLVFRYELYDVHVCNLNHEHLELIDSVGGFYDTDIETNGILYNVGYEWENVLKKVN